MSHFHGMYKELLVRLDMDFNTLKIGVEDMWLIIIDLGKYK